ncbi:MFS transporter [Corynespora cassiicola Philippines]|uniref:MFS transporter n=1 Tax=Corynespora cassiicola Philippines TaxID=1448308 RepID=A0A2T2NEM3_CORCC|nr:MFS transporter [Corynespora cassiicola Philippines]
MDKPTAAEQLEHHSSADKEHSEDLKESGEVDVLDEERNRKLNRRLDIRVLPLCAWVYLLNFLDRGNIGNSKVLNKETGDDLMSNTGLTANGYALTVTLFSLAYAIFEVPSNYVMKHYVRPSLWLGFLLFAWGALTIGFAGVQNYATVVVLRFLIGAFEAGFFPGIVYFITIWYRFNERAVRIAIVIAFCNLAGAFGGAIAFGVGHINGAAGLEGFRWLFIIEGIITLLSAFLLWFYLPDYPALAKWLSASDKKFAVDRLLARGGGYIQTHASRREIRDTCLSPRMLLHYLAYVADVVPQGSFTFFTPTIVTGLGYSSIQAQLLTVPPWVVGFVVAISLSWSADRFNARGWHVAGASVVGGVGWLTAGLLPRDAYVQRYGCLCLAAAGAFPAAPSMTNWVTCNTPSFLTIALAVALHNSCAGVGQIVAQWIWKEEEAERGYPTGNFVCAGCSFFVAAVAIGLRLWYARMNRLGVKDASGQSRIWAL